MAAEAALGIHDHGTATMLFDFEKLYENRETHVAMIRIGGPPFIAPRIVYMYLGARCIALAGRTGAKIYPSKGLIPGCTMATVIFSAYIKPHADVLVVEVDCL